MSGRFPQQPGQRDGLSHLVLACLEAVDVNERNAAERCLVGFFNKNLRGQSLFALGIGPFQISNGVVTNINGPPPPPAASELFLCFVEAREELI